MDYKEKYENGVECIQEILGGAGDSIKTSILRKRLQAFFPELAESEDERIRKDIISYLRNEKIVKRYISDIEIDKWLAWLEKQREKKDYYTKQELIDMGFSFTLNGDIVTPDKMMEDMKKYLAWKEKHDEQKPVDKTEPKFKVGDWIVNNISKNVFLIKSTINGYCTLEDIKGNIISPCLPPCESETHLWTIEDAKDGDILVGKDGRPFIFTGEFDIQDGNPTAYCGINSNDKFITGKGSHWTFKDGIKPATKEQRELLFQQMKGACYTWDSENKELRKIKPKTHDADNKIKELFKKSSQNYYKAIGEVREIASAYLKKIVRSKGGKIIDNDDDELLDSIAISYDGGNHPEYASSAACSLLSIVLNDKDELEFNVEDEEGLDLSRITTEDLVYITDTFSKLI